MEILIAVIMIPLVIAAGALAIWTLTLLALEERWFLFALGLVFFVPVGIYLIWKRKPRAEFADTARLLTNGAILAAALFVPLWALLAVFFILLAMEIKAALWEKTGSGLYFAEEYPLWPRISEEIAPLPVIKFRTRRAGLLEEIVPVEEAEPEEI